MSIKWTKDYKTNPKFDDLDWRDILIQKAEILIKEFGVKNVLQERICGKSIRDIINGGHYDLSDNDFINSMLILFIAYHVDNYIRSLNDSKK